MLSRFQSLKDHRGLRRDGQDHKNGVDVRTEQKLRECRRGILLIVSVDVMTKPEVFCNASRFVGRRLGAGPYCPQLESIDMLYQSRQVGRYESAAPLLAAAPALTFCCKDSPTKDGETKLSVLVHHASEHWRFDHKRSVSIY